MTYLCAAPERFFSKLLSLTYLAFRVTRGRNRSTHPPSFPSRPCRVCLGDGFSRRPEPEAVTSEAVVLGVVTSVSATL